MRWPTRRDIWARIGDASTIAWLWALSAGATAAVIGVLQHVPLFYLFVGTVVVFSAAATGLLRFDEWRSRLRVEHKLGFAGVRVLKTLSDGVVKTICIGFTLESKADFPIEFEVVSLYTDVENRCPPKKPYQMARFTVPPSGMAWFDDFAIALDNAPRSVTVEATLRFAVRYGWVGRLRYELKKSHKVFIGFDDHGDAASANWIEVPNV
jgi:hypothetical protein